MTSLLHRTVLIVILAALLPLKSHAHPIHVSVCEITHDAEKDMLKITIKLFADDFGDVLSDRSNDTIFLMEEVNAKADTMIVEYLNEKFQIDINGQPVQVKYLGSEVEEISVWCYLYVDNIDSIATLKVRDEVMLHWFKDQVNVVHLDCNDKLKSTFFNGKNIEQTFTFK